MAGKQGFASMSKEKRRAIASEGGKASTGKFTEGSRRASEAGRRGAVAQPLAAKRLGGKHSHKNR